MHLHLIALAEDRVAGRAQASRHRWSDPEPGPSGVAARGRRALARVLVGVSLASAAAVERLDSCMAEDLGRRSLRADGA